MNETFLTFLLCSMKQVHFGAQIFRIFRSKSYLLKWCNINNLVWKLHQGIYLTNASGAMHFANKVPKELYSGSDWEAEQIRLFKQPEGYKSLCEFKVIIPPAYKVCHGGI